MDFMKKL